MEIDLPHNGWTPRPHQMGLWRYLESGGKRSVVLAHRRWGKDEVALHRTAIAAHERVAEYWHCLPLFVQARKAIWAAINPHTGRRRIDEAFPKEIRASTNETEMRITFKNGSAWRVVGSDNPDSLVGTAPAGIIFSEWALAAPSAWAYLAPILEENNGWAMFISTPRGRNHLHSMYKMAQTAPGWSAFFSSVVESGFSIDRVEAARAEYTAIFGDDAANALIDQEYYCSFDAAILGSYYGRALAKALAEGRTGQKFGAEPGYPIHRAWDLGIGDSMAIWFFQVIGREIRLLAYYEADGMGMDHYAEVIRQKMSIRGGIDYVPHDARVRELLSGGKTRVEGMKLLGLNPRVIGIHKVEDGINAVRRVLSRCIWHERAEPGLEKLRHYRKEWDEDKRVFKNTPLHDFSSHCFVGETEVLTRHGLCQINNLPYHGEVLTLCGWKPYHNPRITRADAQLVEVRFRDGLTVKCTPDHMFLTTEGWKSALSLKPGSLIQSALTTSPNIFEAAYIACGQVRSISRRAAAAFIGMFGLMPSGKSPLGATSTTATTTDRTTCSGIWSACRPPRISLSPGSVGAGSARLASTSLITRARGLLSGIRQKSAAFGISAMPSIQGLGRIRSASFETASIAASRIWGWSGSALPRRNTAPRHARPLPIESVELLSERSAVWCLTVPDTEHFALSNGAVAHNCADAFRALAIAYEEVAVLQPAKPRPQMLITPEGVAIPDGQITIDNAWNLPASLGENPLGYD